MINGPRLWTKLLKEAPKGSVLMGGAIIDHVADVPPKDFDIFHTYKIGLPKVPPNWKMSPKYFNDPEWVEAHDEEYLQGVDENGHKPIGSVYEYVVDGQHIVQLIGVHYDNPLQHFYNFDHSLTLGYFSKKGLFVHRKVFDSLANEVVEYVGKNKTIEAREKSLSRAQVKAGRYGGEWKFLNFLNLFEEDI